MSVAQWILLVVAVALVVAIYVYSRRDRRAMHQGASGGDDDGLFPPRDQQLDIFSSGDFDEFGVGKPRRVAPRADASAAMPPSADMRGSRVAPVVGEPGMRPEYAGPDTSRADVAAAPAKPGGRSMAPPARAQVEEKIVSLLLAERDGGRIDGTHLHAALEEQKLEYGARRIYHRLHNGAPVFSVASLVKPGHLDPAEATGFDTPGLMLFMVLPGPQQPALAIRDMLVTAGRLAESLNGQVYDAKRKLLTAEAGRELQLDVEAWTAEYHGNRQGA